MMGIQNLKDRQGLSMDASIVHGRPEELQVWSSSFFFKEKDLLWLHLCSKKQNNAAA